MRTARANNAMLSMTLRVSPCIYLKSESFCQISLIHITHFLSPQIEFVGYEVGFSGSIESYWQSNPLSFTGFNKYLRLPRLSHFASRMCSGLGLKQFTQWDRLFHVYFSSLTSQHFKGTPLRLDDFSQMINRESNWIVSFISSQLRFTELHYLLIMFKSLIRVN